MHRKILVRAVAPMLLGLLVVAGAATAGEQKPVAPPLASINVQGVQVAIDPATGRLVAPTAEQRAALSRAMLEPSAASAPTARAGLRSIGAPRNEAEALQTFRNIRLQNGRQAIGMDVPESLMSGLEAERAADGSVNIHHQGDSHQAATEVTQ